jgi:glyoxylase-like metal-dependent hydrolase (beta-lactamase superfamily II)
VDAENRTLKQRKPGRLPGADRSSRTRTLTHALVAVLALALTACASKMLPAVEQGGEVIRTAGPNQSMIYAVDTEDGVVLVDLGWWGAEDDLRARLARMGRDTADVVAVFLTHAHRDHIVAWTAVPHAKFYLAEGEVDEFFGEAHYDGWIPKLADRIHPPRLPQRGEVDVVPFASDTAFVFGADTVRVFLVPGHTDGSSAYLVRGVLFAGDAIGFVPLAGFKSARRGFSDDTELAADNLGRLFDRLKAYDVDAVCTAHARCGAFTEAFRSKILPARGAGSGAR